MAGAVELEGELCGDVEAAQVGARLDQVGPADDAAALAGNQDEVGSRVRMLEIRKSVNALPQFMCFPKKSL